MNLSDREYYRALKAQDPRFDGRFYICVTSTGIYCRPVCPARTSKFANCVFVRTAAAAEEAGYRPCLRCRPETAPGSAARMGKGAMLRRALRLIAESTTQGETLKGLASRLGVSDRHLRRLFQEELGAAPQAIAHTQRFAIARQLLRETDLPISQVALAAGFGSIRRFNDATRKAFDLTPSELRKKRAKSPESHGITLRLGYRPPLAWSELLSFLRTRAISGVERVSDSSYQRTLCIDGVPGLLLVRNDAARNRLVVTFDLPRPVVLTDAIRRVKDMFDLDAAPADINEGLGEVPLLRPLIRRTPGLRIPGSWDLFELSVRAIIGQQITVRGATTVLARLVEALGTPTGGVEMSPGGTELTRLFPHPSSFATRRLEGLGLTRARTRTLRVIAEAFTAEPRFVHAAMDVEEARQRLLDLPGIGPWTADLIALRGLRDPDAFPFGDCALLKASGLATVSRLKAAAKSWRPWRAYAVLHLWNSLARKEAT